MFLGDTNVGWRAVPRDSYHRNSTVLISRGSPPDAAKYTASASSAESHKIGCISSTPESDHPRIPAWCFPPTYKLPSIKCGDKLAKHACCSLASPSSPQSSLCALSLAQSPASTKFLVTICCPLRQLPRLLGLTRTVSSSVCEPRLRFQAESTQSFSQRPHCSWEGKKLSYQQKWEYGDNLNGVNLLCSSNL